MFTNWIDVLISEQMTKWQKHMSVLYFLKFTKDLILTGSRFFGTNTPYSDYDFFIDQDKMDIHQKMRLRSLGFVVESKLSRYASDPSIDCIYVYHGGIDVHIQVIKTIWYEPKCEAQKKIKDLFEIMPDVMAGLSKNQMKNLWRNYMGI